MGIIPALVGFGKVFQPGVSPVTHRDHDRLLIHLELAAFAEMQTPFPSVPETVRPFTRVAVALMPDVFLRPKPALFSQSQDQFQDINVTLTRFCLFFDVENKAACGFQHPKKLFTSVQKPVNIFLRFDAAVSFVALVCVGGRSDDKVECPPLESTQHLAAIALYDVCCDHKRIIAAKALSRQFKTGFKLGSCLWRIENTSRIAERDFTPSCLQSVLG